MVKNIFNRLHLLLLPGLFLLFSFPCILSANSLPAAETTTAYQRLCGLDRHYDLTFLWFDRLAIGELSFRQDPQSPGRYRARLEARTLGVAAWLTGDRIQSYETLMEATPEGRLFPREYRAMIHKKKGGEVTEQTKLYIFDGAARTILLTRSRDGKKGVEQPVKILGDRFPVDFLTAGFNFISGVDGPLRPGERKEIVTFTDEGERTIVIEVLRADEWPKKAAQFKKRKGTLLKITLPTEILDTSGGAVYALLDEELLPDRALVENVLGMGDVQCELRP